jgi:hypothetical protein
MMKMTLMVIGRSKESQMYFHRLNGIIDRYQELMMIV